MQEAFEAAHALKGAVGNLALTPLYMPLSGITERLRGAQGPVDVSDLMPVYQDALARLRAMKKRRIEQRMAQTLLYTEVYLICFVVVGLLTFWSVRNESRSTADQWLVRLFVAFLCNFTANILFSLVSGGVIPLPAGWKQPVGYALKTLYFVFFIAGSFFWCGYAETELKNDLRRIKLIRLLYLSPFLIALVIVLMNLQNHAMFSVSEEGVYTRHQMYHTFMLLLIAIIGLCGLRHFILSIRESDPIRKAHMRLTASFPVSIVIAWLLSMISEKFPIICVCVMIELLCLYVGSNKQQISMDKLTQVNNRQNLISFMNYKLINHDSQLFLLMVDVDDFKIINDTYGHLEGDNALIHVAEALKAACLAYRQRPYIARYGGDEFIVLIEGTTEEANQLRDSICTILEEIHQKKKQGDYALKVSIGMAKCQSGMSAADLIAAADDELYRIKRDRKAEKEG